jgi:hypothetical protein
MARAVAVAIGTTSAREGRENQDMGMTRAQIKIEVAALDKRAADISSTLASGSITADEAARRTARVDIMREEYREKIDGMRESGSTLDSLKAFLTGATPEQVAMAESAARVLDSGIADLRKAVDGLKVVVDGETFRAMPRWFINRVAVKSETAPATTVAETATVTTVADPFAGMSRKERRAAERAAKDAVTK